MQAIACFGIGIGIIPFGRTSEEAYHVESRCIAARTASTTETDIILETMT